MLFYSLYALVGFLVGGYIVYNLNQEYIAVVSVMLIMALLLCSIKRLRRFMVLMIVFTGFVGVGYICMSIESEVSFYTQEYVTVTGRISEIPYKSENSWCYTMDCKSLQYKEEQKDFDARILMYSENEYSLDDTVRVSGFLKLNETEKNPGCFNAYTYYKSIGTDYRINSLEDSLHEVKAESKSLYSYTNRIRNYICNMIDENFKPDNAVVLKYILTGFKKELDRDYSGKLLNSGVLRCLYSPYYHLIFILFFVRMLLKKVPNGIRRSVICILCILYLSVNPFFPTAKKLFVFTIITELLKWKAKIFRRQDALWIAVLLCAIENPYIIYNEGFVVSVIATLFIIIFFDKIYKRISWFNSNKGVIRVIVMFFISCFIMLPVAAFFFEGVSMYSIFVSILLMPVLFVVYILSFIMLIVYEINLSIGFITLLVDSFVTFIRNIPILIERLPFYYIIVPRMPLSLLVGYITFIAAIYKRKYKKTFYRIISLCIGFSLSFGVGEVKRLKSYTITFLDVGQADCTLTDIPYKCTILVDGGGSGEYNSNYDVGMRDVFPYLRHNNIFTLDYVFVSHYHKDHVEGIISLMDNIKIKNIFLPDCLPQNEYRVIIEEKAKKNKINIQYIEGPQIIELKGGAKAEIIYFDKYAEDENDTSVVMRIIKGNTSCLYTGDITSKAEVKILSLKADVGADILKVAHHASNTSGSEEFLTAVNPDFAVAMLDKDNVYGFPSKETVKMFDSLKIPLITTAEQGCVQFTIKDRRLVWQRKTR